MAKRLLYEAKVRVYCDEESWDKLTDEQMDKVCDGIDYTMSGTVADLVASVVLPGMTVEVTD